MKTLKNWEQFNEMAVGPRGWNKKKKWVGEDGKVYQYGAQQTELFGKEEHGEAQKAYFKEVKQRELDKVKNKEERKNRTKVLSRRKTFGIPLLKEIISKNIDQLKGLNQKDGDGKRIIPDRKQIMTDKIIAYTITVPYCKECEGDKIIMDKISKEYPNLLASVSCSDDTCTYILKYIKGN